MLWFNYMNYFNYRVSKEYGIIFSRVILNIAKNLIFVLCAYKSFTTFRMTLK